MPGRFTTRNRSLQLLQQERIDLSHHPRGEITVPRQFGRPRIRLTSASDSEQQAQRERPGHPKVTTHFVSNLANSRSTVANHPLRPDRRVLDFTHRTSIIVTAPGDTATPPMRSEATDKPEKKMTGGRGSGRAAYCR